MTFIMGLLGFIVSLALRTLAAVMVTAVFLLAGMTVLRFVPFADELGPEMLVLCAILAGFLFRAVMSDVQRAWENEVAKKK